ncbi:hypothetical protein CGMCC3_g798 [Colletotrichum fructicola]|nr:uncharacterized protein CGMCC3_g798 [Colletotrichum fructicola]KAE9583123.1 hypothetical protein CGMCC3_g798 [Colletotrichum fructicola]
MELAGIAANHLDTLRVELPCSRSLGLRPSWALVWAA